MSHRLERDTNPPYGSALQPSARSQGRAERRLDGADSVWRFCLGCTNEGLRSLPGWRAEVMAGSSFRLVSMPPHLGNAVAARSASPFRFIEPRCSAQNLLPTSSSPSGPIG